ncbi:6-phosphogluconolactonase [Corynebacterium mustelae]|uniref:6-phosphogluconolactonase n=1 Tax=Corynebacterium mustelae TaxID=571915 RepID=A0A0G3GXV8_9CORY|nr:6-phosphogluconolactonase [Corynebacterium mustelae]AKK06006.1 6-phosphogluconolactonase [Corynebacterium mustelae]
MLEIIKTKSLEDVCAHAADDFITAIRDINQTGGVHGDGIARVVLTGGGAGIGMLRRLVNADINWELVHVFFGDERNVEVTHPDSNEGQAREALLDHIQIPEANIHGFRLGGIELSGAAEEYRAALHDFAPLGFDIHLLGVGGEGHINSIFPHTAAAEETTELVLPVYDSPKPPAERVTLTFPAITSAQRVWMLVAGPEKAEAVKNIVGAAPALDWPAAGARGVVETKLFVAADAATLL